MRQDDRLAATRNGKMWEKVVGKENQGLGPSWSSVVMHIKSDELSWCYKVAQLR